MPYLGNIPVAGDHVNNFKVLDDISSYTETFDGSASTIVSTSNNTITAVDHRFIQGQRVTYTNGGGGNIGGLTTGTAYFVIFDTASTFKLATNASDAANSVAINLSSVGSGSSHTLNAAFDGVNTKFKITYNNGTAARFNNATQLNIAINNVVQRPNQSALTFTEGFAIEDNHKIVFKVAPTNQDIFWGSIIANTLTTFDISDHKIDTFTGDGSTTEFTLSHTPANNESLMVTINGVLQHPSNTSTARAYTLLASIIQFTAAPGVGDEIQVRHLGFAGATTADVSGFYGRTGNVVLTSNDHITTGNINSSGITTTTTLVTSSDLKQGTSTPTAFTTTAPDQHLFLGKHCMQGCIINTAVMNGSGAGTFDLGRLWLVDDTSIELFITISRTAVLAFTTTYCKAFILKVRGTGMVNSHILYQAQSGGSAPIISSITAGGWTGGNAGQEPHGTQVNVTSGDNNGAYRIVCHYTAISKNEMY